MSIAGESKRRRPLGPLDDYCDELEEEVDQLQKDLATERAARERAEKEAAQYKLWLDETSKSHDATNAHLERAEHERDTALARVKELEASNRALRMTNRVEEADADDQRERRTAAETALASARELLVRVQAWHAWPDPTEPGPEPGVCLLNAVDAWLTSHPAPVAAHCQECVELGACPAEAERLFEESGDDEPEEDAESLIERLDEALCSLLHTGGEIGEHSPRTHLDLFYAKQAESPVAVLPPISESDEAIVGALIDARTPPSKPMPAPVAAPERGKRDVVETAIDLTKDDKHSRWNALMARTAELPVTVMATSEYPSPAPCSGCAAARELLVLWYHNRAETESGELIEVATQNWLKEHGNG
ncbi:MAG TPA: hypothetical protein VFY71_14890 [Planctomycetota bacterium]|nr:hypothetical protein [Planctomycetota bacterium]